MSPFLVERVLTILALLCASAFFAGSETALFSLSRVVRETLQTRSDPASKRLIALLSQPRRLIITIIVCNELINITSSSIAATVTAHALPHAREAVQGALATGVLLPLILLFGERTPKSVALR